MVMNQISSAAVTAAIEKFYHCHKTFDITQINQFSTICVSLPDLPNMTNDVSLLTMNACVIDVQLGDVL